LTLQAAIVSMLPVQTKISQLSVLFGLGLHCSLSVRTHFYISHKIINGLVCIELWTSSFKIFSVVMIFKEILVVLHYTWNFTLMLTNIDSFLKIYKYLFKTIYSLQFPHMSIFNFRAIFANIFQLISYLCSSRFYD
jgi:hypothetical protein